MFTMWPRGESHLLIHRLHTDVLEEHAVVIFSGETMSVLALAVGALWLTPSASPCWYSAKHCRFWDQIWWSGVLLLFSPF
jgi:hypothetical protein